MDDLTNKPRPLFALAIATVFGVGYAPVAPGTFGSAAGLLLWLLLPAVSTGAGTRHRRPVRRGIARG